MVMWKFRLGALVVMAGVAGAAIAAQTQGSAQGPKPFPTAGSTQTAPPAAATTSPTKIPLYPAAQFLESFDAGKGQQFHLYGTDMPVAEIVAFYKTALKNGGRVLFQAPLMHQFDIGRFQEDTMAYPPSMVIKDYTWNGSTGYLHVAGTTSTRYKTIIQIVSAPGR